MRICVGGSESVSYTHLPLAPLIPTERGVSLLIDCGANVDARAEHLVQFAKMGSIYMEHVVGVKNPKVALVNIGEMCIRDSSRPGDRDSQRLQAAARRGTVDWNGSTGTHVSTAWLYVRGAGRARDKTL